MVLAEEVRRSAVERSQTCEDFQIPDRSKPSRQRTLPGQGEIYPDYDFDLRQFVPITKSSSQHEFISASTTYAETTNRSTSIRAEPTHRYTTSESSERISSENSAPKVGKYKSKRPPAIATACCSKATRTRFPVQRFGFHAEVIPGFWPFRKHIGEFVWKINLDGEFRELRVLEQHLKQFRPRVVKFFIDDVLVHQKKYHPGSGWGTRFDGNIGRHYICIRTHFFMTRFLFQKCWKI